MAIHKSAKADSSAKMDCHALPSGKARNDGKRALGKVDSRENVQNVSEQQNDSKNCGGAVGALQKLGKVSDLSGRAFHNFCNTAALLTQS